MGVCKGRKERVRRAPGKQVRMGWCVILKAQTLSVVSMRPSSSLWLVEGRVAWLTAVASVSIASLTRPCFLASLSVSLP